MRQVQPGDLELIYKAFEEANMPSQELQLRLAGIQKALTALYEGGAGMTAASCGREREQFIDVFLSRVLPPGYRFGTGDAIDIHGHKSGQLDVVVEFTFFPSLPGLVGQPRLYFAEGIAAVIEVKSDLAKQWDEVKSTSSALRSLQRKFETPGFTPYGPPSKEIPIFAVGYTGWKEIETVKRKANEGVVDGVLIIDRGLFSTRSDFPNGLHAEGSFSLWGFISALHLSALSVVINPLSPIAYAQ